MEVLYPGKSGMWFNIVAGYALILVTIWSTRPIQRKLFWIDVAFFVSVGVLALYQSPAVRNAALRRSKDESEALIEAEGQVLENPRGQLPAICEFFHQRFRPPGFELPPLYFSLVMIGLGIVTAAAIVFASAELGTLHRLFGQNDPLWHGSIYLLWAVVQQWIQQSFFFVRMERVFSSGVLASFTTAALFGLAHLPNPILAPITFLGGWLLSEIYRRYRSVVPLGIAHGLVGLALALAIPDSLNHHMRVGLGYLQHLS